MTGKIGPKISLHKTTHVSTLLYEGRTKYPLVHERIVSPHVPYHRWREKAVLDVDSAAEDDSPLRLLEQTLDARGVRRTDETRERRLGGRTGGEERFVPGRCASR